MLHSSSSDVASYLFPTPKQGRVSFGEGGTVRGAAASKFRSAPRNFLWRGADPEVIYNLRLISKIML
jgi:hypothetical protein